MCVHVRQYPKNREDPMIQGISSAISALTNLGKRIGNVANNISNVATQGYKRSRSTAVDLPTYSVSTASGTARVGRGSALEDISKVFEQGSFEPAASPTSMAIGGNGFFVVRDSDGRSYYTREGNFHFDQNGSLVNSQGYIVQGWEIDPATGSPQGSLRNIAMSAFSSPPQASTILTDIVNLNAVAADHAVGPAGLSRVWDGRVPNKPIGDLNYEYQTSSKIHDSIGADHDVNIYFDKAGPDGTWEYIVTINPTEDKRAGVTGANAGLLARGTMEFNNSGQLTGMSMELNDGSGNWLPQDPSTDLTNGHFTFRPDFLGNPAGATAMPVQLDFGSTYNGNNWVPAEPSSTQFAAPSHTILSSADGYNAGELDSISVGTDGVISGYYSNGNRLDLFQVATATFQNPNGLEQLGNNLYAETRNSGNALTGSPGSGGRGGIVPNALESSNVDLVEEFSSLILFQRNFEANLKTVEVENKLKGDIINIIS